MKDRKSLKGILKSNLLMGAPTFAGIWHIWGSYLYSRNLEGVSYLDKFIDSSMLHETGISTLMFVGVWISYDITRYHLIPALKKKYSSKNLKGEDNHQTF